MAISPGAFPLVPMLRALEVFDDGGGPALYVAGHFDRAGGLPSSYIAKWGPSHNAISTALTARIKLWAEPSVRVPLKSSLLP
jgi:hypothetical protein